MKLIERYIFVRLLRAFLLALLALSTTVWLTQALNHVNLVTTQGQTIALFFKMSLFLLPEVATLIAPVAVLIAVTYIFTTLNSDSELVVINASGAPQMSLLRPVLVLGFVAAVMIATMTLYFAPISQRLWRTEITDVRANIVTSILREGTFMNIADGLVFHLRNRRSDGSLHGLFVSDSRDPNSTVTYLAQNGTILQSPIGTFLIMTDGTIQRQSKTDGSISMIEFSSYAFDLSTFASQSGAPAYRPGEQSTRYLLTPHPEDPYYQRAPGQFAVELHRRLVAPVYAFVCALVPLIFLVQAESTRRRRALTVTIGIALAVVVRIAGAFLNAVSDSMLLAVLAYVVSIGASLAAVVLILTGTRPHLPDGFADLVDAAVERVSGLFRRTARADRTGW